MYIIDMIDVNSKILWLADYDLSEAPGGAQRSDKIIIDQGKLLGYQILKVTSSTIPSELDLSKYDVVISSNIHALSVKKKNLIEELSQHKYHVRLEHDSNEYLTQEDRVKLFGNCQKTIFLSDFHYEFFKHYYGDIFKNVVVIYDPINTEIFKNHNNEREDKILYSGYLHPLKGAYEFFEFALNNPDKKFVVAGWPSNLTINHLLSTVKNIENLGLIDYDNMHIIYNKYKHLFYVPNLNEPFCRSVAEAVLCGMLLFTNNEQRIGCVGEIRKQGIENFANSCSKAAIQFWETA